VAKLSRRLWLQIKAYAPNTSPAEVKRVLIQSIKDGTYSYPKNWKVGIWWRNSFFAPMRKGEFTREMRNSAESSVGWDIAVIDYLEKT
jgi:hypothetical protein